MRKAAILTSVLLVGCSSPDAPKSSSAPAPQTAEKVKILAFYPREETIIEGGTTLLCYGVTNAKSVRIDPPVEGVSPAFSRCVEVEPKSETRYTLTAEGFDGRIAAQSCTVHVGPDVAGMPKITSFRIEGAQKDYSGATVFTLSFADQNAEEVSISPGNFPTLHGSPSGQFSVKPDKTTTYTLTVKAKNGHVVEQKLTVEVPPR